MSGPHFAVYGASGCGRGIMPLARQELAACGFPAERLVFIDDGAAPAGVNGHRVIRFDQFLAEAASTRTVALAIANSRVRADLAAKCSDNNVALWTLKAENVVVMDDVEIGEGALLSPFTTLTSNIRIGRCFHANLYSYVEHDCVIGDYVTFAPGVKCNGNVHIGDHSYIGAGAVIRQGRPGAPLVIGEGAVVGMGAVVTRDVAPGVTVAGNPARPLLKP